MIRRVISSLIAAALIVGSGFAVFYARTNSGLDEDVPLGCGSQPSYELFPGVSCEAYVTNATKIGLTETEQCVPVVAKSGAKAECCGCFQCQMYEILQRSLRHAFVGSMPMILIASVCG